ncbi:type II secretion system secretin GspD [Dyella psychrodurans]|uniref:Type II secretion system protein GspD n=1 Tax=Dyella psychrodurans TaxID=1927960 RepID=A0A370X463_9GAMM|nr:type II secretion system secretin GspD [Dyella psychrodurans]RDS83213.1 type II secretion system protein GspD [Dyella psychrodurans]
MSHTRMQRCRRNGLQVGAIALAIFLSGCASNKPLVKPDLTLEREAVAGTEKPAPQPQSLNNKLSNGTPAPAVASISTGSGQFVHPTELSTPRPGAAGSGAVTFNFENQPVQAVVKAILGDLLQQNYTIVPGVQGNISFSTSEPVDSSQAIPILETLLSWTHNALIKTNGRYVVMPDKDAVQGNVAPSLGAVAPTGGLQARLFPLHYIAADQMQKLLKPFARPDSILLVDNSRNVIVVAGTPDELANYDRTVRTFDVDWLRGMSVGVFNLQHATVDDLMPQLDGMFGTKGDTPLAGMLRFIPIKRTNALVVISTQPNYLTEVGNWIAKIDLGGGNEPQLYVYDVRNISASDLAHYLAQIYTDNAGGGSNDRGGGVAPGAGGATTLGIGNNAGGSASGMGSTAGSFGSSTTGGLSSGIGGTSGSSSYPSSSTTGGGFGSTSTGGIGGSTGVSGVGTNGGLANNSSQEQGYSSKDGSIRISSVDANNQLLVRARAAQWQEILGAIKQLDVTPMQVQIETRVFEVDLVGDLQYGVQWYLQGLAGGSENSNGGFTPGNPYSHRMIGLGGGIGGQSTSTNSYGGQPFFYSFLSSNGKFQVAINALESSQNTKTLSAPSLVVLNNQVAHIEVGNQIPINQTYYTGLGTTSTATTVGQVQYLPTGIILDVQPRVNPGGLVYLNIDQQVSATTGAANSQGNYTIQQRQIATQLGVQNGQTVLLGGLIQQQNSDNGQGVPWLSDIPILGKLFGSTGKTKSRTELIVLITPRVITDSDDAKQITDDYQNGFESLAPLRGQPAPAAAHAPASTTPLRQ